MEQSGSPEECEHASPETLRSRPIVSPLPFITTPNLPRYQKEFCAPEESLPSSSISQLWKKPLRLLNATSKSSSPPAEHRRRIRNERTPSRKQGSSPLPPTKLNFEDSENSPRVIKSRSVGRRSLSHPEHGLYGSDVNPKRLKLFDESQASPYEELLANQSKSENTPGSGRVSSSTTTLTPAVKKLFSKSQSDSQLPANCSVVTAVEKREGDPNLIGDGSKPHLFLPMEHGKHPDLKEITGETLANLLENKEDFGEGVTFKIIDCRYPYEYTGGHIRGAVNYYTKTQIKEQLLESKTALKSPSVAGSAGANSTQQESGNREILIFHCEFSSKRGPSLCRYLRDIDRASNLADYPVLFYPELYVLHGGYKDFFEQFPHLCEPPCYVPMEHPAHATEFKRYRSSSKLKAKSRNF